VRAGRAAEAPPSSAGGDPAGRPEGSLLLLAALTLLWGSNWPSMKVALREIDPWAFRTVGLLVGGGGLLALVRAGGQSLAVPRADRGRLLVVTLFNITAWHILSAYGLTLIRAGRGAIIGYTMPLWTVLFAWLLVGERLTPGRVVALALGLGSLVALAAPDADALWAAPGGAVLMLAAAACWSLGTVLTKSYRWTTPTTVLTGWQLFLGGVPIAVGAAVRLAAGAPGPVPAGGLSPAALVGLAYATFVGVIFCHWAWFRVVATFPATVAAIIVLGVPIVGVFTSALFLGEPVGLPEATALLLVVGGLATLARDLDAGAESRTGRAGVSRAWRLMARWSGR